MKGERDALLKLIQSLRREYEAVQAAKHAQEDELRSMKDRMLIGVSRVTGPVGPCVAAAEREGAARRRSVNG